MARTFIHRLLDALFKRKKEDGTSSPSRAGNKKIKTTKAGSKAEVKEKSNAEAEVEIEERIRTCALEVKSCIDLINSSSEDTPGRSKRSRRNVNLAGKGAGNHKTSGGRSAKRSKQGASPAEMMKLLAKAEEKVSKAVIKAKENEDKKKDRRTKQR